MSLTSENLVGYLRAEFNKSSRIRVWLFFIQLAAALPPTISVLISDQHEILLYVVAIIGASLLIAWAVLNERYLKANSAAQAARRAALLLGGFQPLSTQEIQTLRERFTVPAALAHSSEMPDYYATQEAPGPARLAAMIEESAVYSEFLQRKSGAVMRNLLIAFAVIIVLVALAGIATLERSTGMTVARCTLALMVFALSSDVVGAWRLHWLAANDIRQIRNRLMTADRAGHPLPDVLLAFVDYNAAVEAAPESVPFLYRFYRKELDQRWQDYQRDRAAAQNRMSGAL